MIPNTFSRPQRSDWQSTGLIEFGNNASGVSSMNARRLFAASCIALITSAFSFMIRQDISDPLGAEFAFTKQTVGEIMGAAFLGMAITMLVFAPLCDFLGMGKVLLCAWLCHL